MTIGTDSNQESRILIVSEETKAVVEKNMPDETSEVKQKVAELLEVIKKQAELEVELAGDITRETFLNAIKRSKLTVNRTEDFFAKQDKSLAKKIRELEHEEAHVIWEDFVDEIKHMNNKVERAMQAAWKAFKEE